MESMKHRPKQIAIMLIILLAVNGFAAACSGSSERMAEEVPPPAPEIFHVAELAINPVEVYPGVEVMITADVTNTGDTEGNYKAELRIDSVSEGSLPSFGGLNEVTIAAGESQLLSFVVSENTLGVYRVTWGGRTGEFVVVEPDEPTATKPRNTPILATWIEPQVNGTTVSIPVSEVVDNWNTHFKLETGEGILNFMAYILDGAIYVRANVCPPCKSIGYSLNKDILVCDRCATTFAAKTGDGIAGACVDFPKALAPYEINGGNILVSEADLKAAYQNTLNPGWP